MDEMYVVQKVVSYMLLYDITILALQAIYEIAPSIFSI
jgi:hypothetical protein